MGVAERKAREREGLRHEILEAARDLFITEGYERVSMRRIAEKIEYSPTTIYLYFKDKTDLLHHICEETFSGLTRLLNALKEKQIADPVQDLREGLRIYVDFGLANPNQYKLTFISPTIPDEFKDKLEDPDSFGWKAYGILLEAVTRCIESGRFQPVDPHLATQAIWASVHGVTSLLIGHAYFPFVDRDRLIDSVIERIVAGFEVRV